MGISERKEKQKAELRNQILEASIKLFLEDGYEGFSIRKIADLIEYSPTTVYLYYKNKNEILFELHELGFRKLAEYNRELADISNPLVRLHKLGENYIRFGIENPEFYNLMFILPAPIEVIKCKEDSEWKSGDDALKLLQDILQECIDRKLIMAGDIKVMAMGIWGMVHGLVALANSQRFIKLVEDNDVLPALNRALNWMINVIDNNR